MSGSADQHDTPTPFSMPPVSLKLLAVLLVLLAGSFAAQLKLTASASFSVPAFICLWVVGLAAGALLANDPAWPADRPWLSLIPGPALPGGSYRLIVVSVLCAVTATGLVWRSTLPLVAACLWAAGMLALLLAVWRPNPRFRLAFPLPRRLAPADLVLPAILALALALRLPALDTLPYFVNYAEADNGLSARLVAQGQIPSLFSYGWANLPQLGYAWEAQFLRLFGDGLYALRLPSVLLGVGSIAVLAALGTELYGRRAGLLAAFLLTVYHMHIHYSRNGLHNMQAVFTTLLTLLLLMRALRTASRSSAAGVGIVLSVDLQTYHAARVCFLLVPLVIAAVLVPAGQSLRRSRFPTLGWIGLSCAVSLGPPAAFILSTWDQFTSRTRDVLIFNGHALGNAAAAAAGNPLDTVRLQLWQAVQTLNFAGDTAAPYPAWYPMLDTISGALIMAAAAYAFFRAPRVGPTVCLIAVVLIFVIGGALTADQPNWDRLVILPPFLALLIASFIDDLWRLAQRASLLRGSSWIAVLALLAAIGYGNYHWYFQEFCPRIRQDVAIAGNMDIGLYLRTVPDQTSVILVRAGDLSFDSGVVRFLAPSARLCFSVGPTACRVALTAPRIYVLTPAAAGSIAELRALHPGGKVTVLHRYAGGGQLVAYAVGSPVAPGS